MKRRYWFPKAYADQAARLRVTAGFLLAGAFAWFASPSPASLALGLAMGVLGLVLRAWAAGHLAKNQRLAATGPYAYVRNPLYLGTLIVALGLVIAARQPWLALLFGAAFLLIYLPAIELEEQHLRNLFPEYEQYAEAVPWLWPRRRPAFSRRGFQGSRYWKNQEYNALLGFLAGALFLAWRAGLLRPLP